MTDAESGPSGIEGRKGLLALARSKKAIKIAAVLEMIFFVGFVVAVVGFTDNGIGAMLVAPVASILLVFSLVNMIFLPKYSDLDEPEGMVPYEIISAKDVPSLVKIVKAVDVERDAFREMEWIRVILEEPSFSKKLSFSLIFAVPGAMIFVAFLVTLIFSMGFLPIALLIPGIFSVFFLYNNIRMRKILNEDVDGGNYIAFCRPSGDHIYMDVPLEMLRRKPKKKGVAM